ncbi:MAG: hypothetical protein SVZ03_08415 [Spirochaetota bacterium]|nr:hypothetical protein [Spirochaetota bacterium]
MILPLDKLVAFQGNRYILCRAAMNAVGKKGNIQGYPEEDGTTKVVSHILNLILSDRVKYELGEMEQ